MKSTRQPSSPVRPERSRRAATPYPQPLAEPGVKLPQHFQDEDEEEAFSGWLRHVEAGRIG